MISMPNRLLTINLRNYLVNQPRRKREMKISSYVRGRIAHYTKTKVENVSISRELSSIMHKRYLYSMKPLKLNISIEKDKATATYFEEKAARPAAPAEAPKTAAKAVEKSKDMVAQAPKTPVKASEKPKGNAIVKKADAANGSAKTSQTKPA